MPLFDCQQRIKKPIPTLSSASVAPPIAPPPLVPSSMSVPVAASIAPAMSTSSITELLLLQLLQTQQMNMHALHSVVPHQQAPLTPTPQVPAASLLPSPAKH